MNPLTLSADRLSLLDDGKPWVWRGTLDWSWYSRFLQEGDVTGRRLLVDRRSVGANMVCCAGIFSWTGLTPDLPGYWDELRHAADVAADEAMRLCFVVFATTRQLGMTDLSSQRAHWERFYTTLGDKSNVSLVLVNQPGHADQPNFDPLAFERTQSVAGFPPLLCARGNPLEDGNPPLPAWDFSCFCCTRQRDRYATVGSSLWWVVNGWPNAAQWPGTHGASILFEGPHFRPAGPWADPGIAREMARGLCYRGTVGGNVYNDQLAQSVLLTGTERSIAVEFCSNLPQP